MGKRIKKFLRPLLALISILAVLLLLVGLGYFWAPEKYLWLPDKYLWMIDYYFRMPERYLGEQRNERIQQAAGKLYEAKGDMEAFREALGKPDDIEWRNGQEAWIYEGYGQDTLIWFDAQSGEIVRMSVLVY